jgi:hypothetical protein
VPVASIVNSEGAIAVPEALGDAIDLDVVGKRRDVSGHATCQSVDNLLTDWMRHRCKSWPGKFRHVLNLRPRRKSDILGTRSPHPPTTRDAVQWACGVGVFINSINILLNLGRSKSIWISTSCALSLGLSLSTQVSVFPYAAPWSMSTLI